MSIAIAIHDFMFGVWFLGPHLMHVVAVWCTSAFLVVQRNVRLDVQGAHQLGASTLGININSGHQLHVGKSSQVFWFDSAVSNAKKMALVVAMISSGSCYGLHVMFVF